MGHGCGAAPVTVWLVTRRTVKLLLVDPDQRLLLLRGRDAASRPAGVDTEAHYDYSGRSYDVHETWLHHHVPQFDPAPTMLSDYENESIVGFRWWSAEELRATDDTVFPRISRTGSRSSCSTAFR